MFLSVYKKPKLNELDSLVVIGFEKYYIEELQNSHYNPTCICKRK